MNIVKYGKIIDVILSLEDLKKYIKKYNTYKECYEKEQSILKTYSSNRLIIEYNGFKTTEAFDINIFKDYI